MPKSQSQSKIKYDTQISVGDLVGPNDTGPIGRVESIRGRGPSMSVRIDGRWHKMRDFVYYPDPERIEAVTTTVRRKTLPTAWTFLIKTFCRPHACLHLYQSIRKHFPDAPIIIVDDGHPSVATMRECVASDNPPRILTPKFDVGLSRGRNIGLDAVATDGVIVMDDDFFVSHRRLLQWLTTAWQHCDHDILGIDLHQAGRIVGPWDFRRNSRELAIVPANNPSVACGKNAGHVMPCDMVANCFAARTNSIRRIKWDPALKICEHWEFFWRAKQAGLSVAQWTPPRPCVHHQPPKNTVEYRRYRRDRAGHFRRLAAVKHGFDTLRFLK